MELLVENGCRTANPGEYTQRAFMNGKMDLSQAEAVADLIACTSAGQHKLALSQIRGGFSKELKELRNKLLHITSLMELELDFADHEELEFADRSELKELASQISSVIQRLADSFRTGNAIKNGIPVAIHRRKQMPESTSSMPFSTKRKPLSVTSTAQRATLSKTQCISTVSSSASSTLPESATPTTQSKASASNARSRKFARQTSCFG